MSLSAVHRRYAVSLMLGMGLVLGGCATSQPTGVGPEVSDRPSAPATSDASPRGEEPSKTVVSTAPLLPSLFFAGGTEPFVSWRCTPAQDLVSVYADNELRLWSRQGAYRLEPAVVASGSRYVKDDLEFWSQGDTAQVESDKGRLTCERDMARSPIPRSDRPGAMFHGRGNEPGWVVNLAHDTPDLTLTLDYGKRELALPYRVTTMDNQAGRVVLESGRADHPFRLELEARACFDSMSGSPYPVRVVLEIDGETYRGCGQGIAP
ncbi:MliC family protein [Litchfieldella xinjiangensis]|uniref:MliC family protein n=1 Tax=Litchfieldella xinjiangensis TaxID=1166948 RepID=UPI0005B9DEDF|nr:MliC family protein [Halomonas xinjiangensis]